jgi:tetratricopeptide (TPR) repeat protein
MQSLNVVAAPEARLMAKVECVVLAFIIVAMGGCASYQVAGQVQSGRRALLMKDPESALADLLQAADQNPNYIYTSANFRESVWTYVGRAQYALGRYDEARRSFQRALSIYPDDSMAELYLGLALLRTGDRAQGLKHVQTGLKGLYDWIEYLNRLNPNQAFWDPNASIRKEIDKTLAMISSERVEDLNALIESAEWIGQQMEEEVDRVRTDERREFQRDLDGDGRRGFGFGLGIGF